MDQVTVFAPDGTQGSVPFDRVADAVKAGGQIGIPVYAPDGTPGYVPQNRVHDAIVAGGTLEPKDTRNAFQKGADAVQKGVDALTTVTPEQKADHGAIINAAQEFGAGAIQGVTAPIVHPMDTLHAVGHILSQNPLKSAHEEVNALYDNPAKFAGNVAGGAVLGEAAAPVVGRMAKGATAVGKRALLLGEPSPEAAYQSALKPSTTLSPADRAAVVDTALKNELPVSKAGLEKLGDRIDAVNQAIKDEIQKDPTRPIDPNKVATRADEAKAKFAKQVNAQGDLKSIEASKQQFLEEQGALPQTISSPAQPAPPMNAIDAQEMKQGTYKVLKGKFGEQGSASVEAQKALARGLKEEIATQFPEINTLNGHLSELLDLQPVLERAVNRISNHQAIGIGTPIAGAAAKAVTGSGGIGVVVGVLKGVLDNPAVKSRLAIAISKSSKIPIGQAMGKVQAYSSALGSTVAESTSPDSQAYSSAGNPSQPTTPQP